MVMLHSYVVTKRIRDSQHFYKFMLCSLYMYNLVLLKTPSYITIHRRLCLLPNHSNTHRHHGFFSHTFPANHPANFTLLASITLQNISAAHTQTIKSTVHDPTASSANFSDPLFSSHTGHAINNIFIPRVYSTGPCTIYRAKLMRPRYCATRVVNGACKRGEISMAATRIAAPTESQKRCVKFAEDIE